jgi:hypothetical protein
MMRVLLHLRGKIDSVDLWNIDIDAVAVSFGSRELVRVRVSSVS